MYSSPNSKTKGGLKAFQIAQQDYLTNLSNPTNTPKNARFNRVTHMSGSPQ